MGLFTSPISTVNNKPLLSSPLPQSPLVQRLVEGGTASYRIAIGGFLDTAISGSFSEAIAVVIAGYISSPVLKRIYFVVRTYITRAIIANRLYIVGIYI